MKEQTPNLSKEDRKMMLERVSAKYQLPVENFDMSDALLIEWYNKIDEPYISNNVSAINLMDEQNALRDQWNEGLDKYINSDLLDES